MVCALVAERGHPEIIQVKQERGKRTDVGGVEKG
jgi:hypothetical protein